MIIREGEVPVPVEIKSGATIASDFFRGLGYWSRLTNSEPANGWLVYGGEAEQQRSNGRVLGWRSLAILKRHVLDLTP